MELDNKNLVEWFQEINPKKAFPHNGRVNYFNRYTSVKEFLDNYVHPEISTMTLSFNDGMYLTKHGTEHIDVVIQRLSELVNTGKEKDLELTPYEVYLLLIATQLHDTGHIKKGRLAHEYNSNAVLQSLGGLLGTETPEKKMIWSIADAHGGRTPDGKKDKIDILSNGERILGQKVRPRVLAALLRFADELSDDYTRANQLLLSQNMMKKGSEIFQYYASVLHSVEIDHEGREIRLSYLLSRNHLIKKYGKQGDNGTISEVYLIDEIYERLFKMFKEFIYCMRFIPYQNKFDTISAKIQFVDSDSLSDFLDPISIILSEKGYPEVHATNLFELCSDTLYKENIKIDGNYFHEVLNTQDVQE